MPLEVLCPASRWRSGSLQVPSSPIDERLLDTCRRASSGVDAAERGLQDLRQSSGIYKGALQALRLEEEVSGIRHQAIEDVPLAMRYWEEILALLAIIIAIGTIIIIGDCDEC